jgi:hypothetical protein
MSIYPSSPQDKPNQFQQELETLNEPPRGMPVLPLTHLTAAKCLKRIVTHRTLHPRECHTLGQELLFLTYGGIHYRPTNDPTENPADAPVAFVFHESLLLDMDYLFPYDTGVIGQSDRLLENFPSDIKCAFSLFDDYRLINDTKYMHLKKLITHIYGSNENYVMGKVESESDLSSFDRVSRLRGYLARNLSKTKIDRRYRTIECQTTKPIQLLDYLIWIGVPWPYYEFYLDLCTLRIPPKVVHCHPYKLEQSFRPAELAAILAQQAREDVIEKYLVLERRGNNG